MTSFEIWVVVLLFVIAVLLLFIFFKVFETRRDVDFMERNISSINKKLNKTKE